MNWYKTAQEEASSKNFEWHYDASEIFEFVFSQYDVRKAKEIIHNKPRVIGNMALEGMKTIIPRRPVKQEDGSFSMHPGISVNWERIDTEEVDLSVPVIVITQKNGGMLPIDGWHRMAKALDKGMTHLPAVLLNRKESLEVTF